jgi:hypothetical protein
MLPSELLKRAQLKRKRAKVPVWRPPKGESLTTEERIRLQKSED